MQFLLFMLTLFMFSIQAQAASLTAQEQKINQFVINSSDAQLQLLEKLVNINSGTTNIDGVIKVGNIVAARLKSLGFETKWIDEPSEMHKAPTLIAEHRGSKGKRLLLIGHLDTVFPANAAFKAFSIKKSWAKGPGTLDDKGGIVVILFALQALQTIHALDNAQITVVLTGDEEESGKPASISRKPLLEAAKSSDVALDFESAVTLDTASIGRRGISNWMIHSYGNESHSATIFQQGVGDGAIFEMARILNTMRTSFGIDKDVTYNPGMVVGGTKIEFDPATTVGEAFGKNNVVSKAAMVKGDFRYLTVKEREMFKEKLSSIVRQHLAGTKSEVEFQDGIPAMTPTKANISLLHQYGCASSDLGLGEIKILDPSLRGAGDISYVADMVPANLVGLGPMGLGAHSVIEKVDIKSLVIQTRRAAILIYRSIS